MTLVPLALIFESVLPEDGGVSPIALSSLESYGFQTLRCSDLAQLTQKVRQHAPLGHPLLVVLAAEITQNCAAANYLRVMHPSLGILALSEDSEENNSIRLLQSGVDNICMRTASGALVTTTLFRMLARLRQQLKVVTQPLPVKAAVTTGRWSLSDQDWVINSPEGQRISLTTGERAFLVTLLNAPERRASHADLISAINVVYDTLPESDFRQSRLSVMVSRLRSKFQQHGVDLPLKSMHRWGYMFSGRL